MQNHRGSKTEDVLSMWNEDDLCLGGDREDLEVGLEVEGTQSKHLPSRRSVLDLAVMAVVVSEGVSKVVEVVVSEADSEVGTEVGTEETEVTEVTEVGMEEEEVSAIKIEEVVGLAVVRLLTLLVVREEEVDSEDTKIDETDMEVVGMVVVEIEAQLAATEILWVAAEIDTTIEIGMAAADETTTTVRESDNTTVISTTIERSADTSDKTVHYQSTLAHPLREFVLLSAIIMVCLVGMMPLCMLHPFKFPTRIQRPWLR